MVRAMFTGGWCARLDGVAKSYNRPWRNWESWMPRAGHGLKRWREASPGVAWSVIRGNCLIVLGQAGRWRSSWIGCDWSARAVLARHGCEPSSELHVAEQWYRTTALDIYDERLYRALDGLLPRKESLEKHLVKRLGELFELDYDLLLYDVTSTYFEGVADPAIAETRLQS